MNWFRVDIPPVYILNGDRPLGGFGEKSMQFVIDRLPQYEHRIATMNLKRGLDFLKRGDPICFSTLLKNTEREAFVEFSIPSQIVFPLHLVVLKEQLGEFDRYRDENGDLDLDAMLAGQTHVLGLASGRSYSRTIDDILTKHAGSPALFERSSMNVSNGLMEMLDRKRVDCILEFPVTVGYTQKSTTLLTQETAFIPIKNLPPYFITYFALPKNIWGEKVVGEINAILREHRTSKKFMDFYGIWLDVETRQRYYQTVREAFDNSDG